MKNLALPPSRFTLLLLFSMVFAFTGCQWLCRNFDVGCPPAPAFVCEAPTEIGIEKMIKEGNSYRLTYSWNTVPTANSYAYQFLINGEVTQTGNTQRGTSLAVGVTTENIGDILELRIQSVCKAAGDTTSTQSEPVVHRSMFMNTVVTDDIVFMVKRATPIDTLLKRVCEADSTGCTIVAFEEGFIRNVQGDTVVVLGPYEQFKYYNILELKNCLCPPTGSIDSLAICLDSLVTKAYYSPDSLQQCNPIQ